MVLIATFNNIAVISWRSDLLEEESGGNHFFKYEAYVYDAKKLW